MRLRFVMQWKDEDGQAIVLLALAMGIFLLGAVGLGFDGSNLYFQRQASQLAADAAAQAGMISIFNGTNGSGAAAFTATTFTCTTTDAKTPCKYARMNGFGGTSIDTVTVDFPPDSAAPGVSSFSTTDPVHLIRVTVSRSVNTTLMRLLGPTATTVNTTAMAAIIGVVSPTPIVVTHPTLAKALYLNGTTDTIKICGGPTRSIQVNSSNADAFHVTSGNVDLSQAGPSDPGDCSATTGSADFAVTGGPTADPGVNFGTGGTGKYVSNAFPIDDPLKDVPAPTAPANPGSHAHIGPGIHGCTNASGCEEYTPGLWPGGLDLTGKTVIFDPGLYYVQGGGVTFKSTVGGQGAGVVPAYSAMCSGCTADPDTGTGMVIYDTVPAGTAPYPASQPTGGFSINTGVNFAIQGASKTTTNAKGETVPAGPYFGILCWEDRTADAHVGNNPPTSGGSHGIGQGSGCFTLIGTIYMTNTLAIMSNANHYQSVTYNGNPCSATIQQGYVIASTLELKGTTSLTMDIPPYGYRIVRKLALIQ